MEALANAPADEASLWRQLRCGGDAAARARLAEMHRPYARTIAAMLYARRLHQDIEFDDYLQLASVGLLEALDRFDPERGVQFRTFAARRMHGAVLDGLERLTEKQQQIAARQRLRAERLQDVKAQALQAAGAREAGPRTPAQLLQFVSETGIGLALCWLLEGSGMVEEPERAEAQPFYRSVELRQLRERLLQALEGLPARERTVVRNHYLQEMAFEDIAALLQVSKGRISQIHRQALLRLRAQLGPDADWTVVF
jgi:RNA polymerase sigma factor for flagellar operon FliA